MSFARSLSIADAMEEAINKEARVISLMMLTGLSKVSPVDTGRFRGNWFVSLGQSDRTIDEGRRVSTAVPEGSNKIGWSNTDCGNFSRKCMITGEATKPGLANQ